MFCSNLSDLPPVCFVVYSRAEHIPPCLTSESSLPSPWGTPALSRKRYWSNNSSPSLFAWVFFFSPVLNDILMWISCFVLNNLELPWWLSGKKLACQCRRHRFNPWVRRIPWRRKRQPTPVLPGKSRGQRNLAGYSPWGHKRVRHQLATKQQQQIDFFFPFYLSSLFFKFSASAEYICESKVC